MSFKIGFTADTGRDEKKIIKKAAHLTDATAAKKSVVEVFFPDRHITCSYYNDKFDLKRGDTVYVEGKLEGLRGRVMSINYTFKIKLSDYKRVIGVANTNVVGEFHLAGSHLITADEDALGFEKVSTWFKAPNTDEEEYVSSGSGEAFNLADLGAMKIKKETAERGHDYYMENRVVYIELSHGKGRALVIGCDTYDVEFDYNNEDISNLVCSCYCTGACKHQFATMLQLRDIIETIKKEYAYIDWNDYVAAVSKASFFEFVIDGNTKGTFSMG